MPVVFQFDQPREIKWTMRAQARNASLDRPQVIADLAKPKKRLAVMCAFLWSAIVDRVHPFTEPDDVAEYLQTQEQQLAAISAIRAMWEEAFPTQKKSEPPSMSGPSSSSNSGSAPTASTTGN